MPSWLLILALKPLAVLVVAFAYYWFVYRLSKWLDKGIPDSSVKRALFRERGD